MTRTQTTQIKGVAIMLMMWHHLFGTGDTLVSKTNEWIGMPYDILFGISGKICIFIFLMCTAYGLYRAYISSENTTGGSFEEYYCFVLIIGL